LENIWLKCEPDWTGLEQRHPLKGLTSVSTDRHSDHCCSKPIKIPRLANCEVLRCVRCQWHLAVCSVRTVTHQHQIGQEVSHEGWGASNFFNINLVEKNHFWAQNVLNTLLSKTIFEYKMCWTHYWAKQFLSTKCVEHIIEQNNFWAQNVLSTLLSKTIFEHKMCWAHYWAKQFLSTKCVKRIEQNNFWAQNVLNTLLSKTFLSTKCVEHIIEQNNFWAQNVLNALSKTIFEQKMC